jgi:pimeloyl-ACP methyl ester carboxylesterase
MDTAEPMRRTFRAQGLQLSYVDWGNGGAPPIVLVHGGHDHARSWDIIARGLKDRWRVVALDLRGHGDSGRAPGTSYLWTDFMLDLAGFIDHLGYPAVTIVAHSMGGAIALRFAGLFPERVMELVAVEAHGIPYDHRPDNLKQRGRDWVRNRLDLAHRPPTRYACFEDALARMRHKHPQLSGEMIDQLTRHGVLRNADGSYSWKVDPQARFAAPVSTPIEEVHALWAEIRCPVLLCWGSASYKPDPHPDVARFGDARTAIFPAAGHWLHHQQPGAFLAALTTFLDGAAADRAADVTRTRRALISSRLNRSEAPPAADRGLSAACPIVP